MDSSVSGEVELDCKLVSSLGALKPTMATARRQANGRGSTTVLTALRYYSGLVVV